MIRRLLLDTSSLMYRAFFALPDSITDEAGVPVNALHGYLDMTARLASSRRPDEVVHCFDQDWKPAPRVEAFAGYKSTRQPDPPSLPPQFVLLRTVLDAFGATQAEAEGWEAEDAIGAICAAAPMRDRHEIVTGDRDLLQLVRDPQVRVLFTRRGVSDLEEFDEAAVLAKYGVQARRYADFAILRGDPSDALPGVRGVGEKTARALVDAYPSIDAMVKDAAAPRRTGRPLQRSPGLRAAIRDAAGYLDAMRRIVPIRTDVEVRRWAGRRDDPLLDRLAKRHRLEGPVRRLRGALGEPSPVPELS